MAESIQTNRFTIDRAAYLKTMYTYSLWPRLGGVVAVLAVVTGYLAMTSGKDGVTMGLGVMAVFLPVALVIRYFSARRNIYSPAAKQVFDDPRTMTFSEEGMHTQTEGGLELKVPWSHIGKVKTRGGFTLLFSTKIVHLIVADSAFQSSADHAAFLELLKRQGYSVKNRSMAS